MFKGTFYELELQAVNIDHSKEYHIEKILRRHVRNKKTGILVTTLYTEHRKNVTHELLPFIYKIKQASKTNERVQTLGYAKQLKKLRMLSSQNTCKPLKCDMSN